MATLIDSDEHLYEPRSLWAEHVDPAWRHEALRIETDRLGYSWVVWRDQRLGMADVQFPGETDVMGERRQRQRAGLACDQPYDDVLPADYWEPAARARRIRAMGFDAAVCFPNFGLMWERRLQASLPALLTNMGAWNRWCATVVAEGGGALHPVAHLTLRDLDWLNEQLATLGRAGVRLAMIAPALVDGKPLSHPAFDRAWSAFVAHGMTPVFHVADQPRVFDDAWYTDDGRASVNVVEAVFLWTPAALALTDLIVNGVLQKHPELRLGVVELSAFWVPQYLMMLDGGYAFTARLNGGTPAELKLHPSEYFRRQVRVSAFSYEMPRRLVEQAGDLFMCCSDYPHSEGTATPLDDYRRQGDDPEVERGLFGGNVELLVRA